MFDVPTHQHQRGWGPGLWESSDRAICKFFVCKNIKSKHFGQRLFGSEIYQGSQDHVKFKVKSHFFLLHFDGNCYTRHAIQKKKHLRRIAKPIQFKPFETHKHAIQKKKHLRRIAKPIQFKPFETHKQPNWINRWHLNKLLNFNKVRKC